MNKVIITGNITKEPENKQTTSGISVTTFTVAVNRHYKDANGDRQADFINVVAWRSTADYVAKYMVKGTKVAVSGSIQTRSYEAKDGSKRYVTEIIADDVEALVWTEKKADDVPDGFVQVDDGEELPF